MDHSSPDILEEGIKKTRQIPRVSVFFGSDAYLYDPFYKKYRILADSISKEI